MQLIKSINYKIILVIAFIILGLCGISLFAMLPSDSGPEPPVFLSILTDILSFPSILVFMNLFSGSLLLLVLGYLINSIFYAFLIERIIHAIKIFKR